MGIKQMIKALLAPPVHEVMPVAVAAKPRKLTHSAISTAAQSAKEGDVEPLQRMYLDMESYDAQVCAEYVARRARLSGAPWEISAPSKANAKEQKAAEQVADMLGNLLALPGLIHDLSDAIGKGFASCEIIWQVQQGVLVPTNFVFVEQTLFKFEDGVQKLRTKAGAYEDLIPGKWITHSRSPFSGEPWGRGLFLPLLICHMYKSYSVQDWGEYLERFGIPTVLGKYPDGANEDFRRALKSAVQSIKNGAMGIAGMSTEIQLIQPPSGGQSAIFADHVSYWDMQISKILSGGTLTGNASAIGSYGQARIHADKAAQLTRRDAAELEASIKKGIIAPYCLFNGLLNAGDRLPEFRFDLWSREEAEAAVGFLAKAQAAGMEVPKDWAQKLVGIPAPQKNEEVLQPPPRARPQVALRREGQEPDQADLLAEDAMAGEGDLADLEGLAAGDEISVDDFLRQVAQQESGQEALSQAAVLGAFAGMVSEQDSEV